MYDRFIDHMEIKEIIKDYFNKENALPEEKDLIEEKLLTYVRQQHKKDNFIEPSISFYTKDLNDITKMLPILIKNEYNVLIYPEEDAFIIHAHNPAYGDEYFRLINMNEVMFVSDDY